MAATLIHPPGGRVAGERTAETWTSNLVTALGGAWMVLGLLIDGYIHVNKPELETFFSPAHGVLTPASRSPPAG